MKTKLLTGALLALSLIFVGANTVSADTLEKDGNQYHVVKSGDTLSAIGEEHGVHFTVLHGNNEETIEHADVIEVGQEILVGGKDFDSEKVKDYGQVVTEQQSTPQTEEQVVEPIQEQGVEYNAPQNNSYVSQDDNWHRVNRRRVESTDNYNIGSANGYIGAYQFAPETWNSIASQYGLNPHDYSPANQDAMADAYAQEVYDGWQNVPTSGGW